jgi:zinc protease
MPIYEPGVTDITITIAWPSDWAYEASLNPAVPYIGADALRRPQFDPRWVHRVKGIIRQHMRSENLKTETKMWNLARKANWGGSPLYHFLTLPDLTVIDDVSVDMLRQWHEQTLTQSGLTIVVTGAISRQDAGSSVDTLLFDLPKRRVSPPHDVNVTIKPQTVFLHVPEAEKTTIGILGRLPLTSQGDDLTDLLALSHFAQNGSGPLFSALRTEQRVSYGFQAGF